MRILLIQSYLGHREPPVAPLGLAILAAQVKGHDIRIFDPNVAAEPQADTVSAIEDFSPELIAFSLRNIDTTKYSDQFLYFTHVQKQVEHIAGMNKGRKLAVGGSGFSLEAESSFPALFSGSADLNEIPGLGDLNFVPVISAFDEVDFSGFIVLDLFDIVEDPSGFAKQGITALQRKVINP